MKSLSSQCSSSEVKTEIRENETMGLRSSSRVATVMRLELIYSVEFSDIYGMFQWLERIFCYQALYLACRYRGVYDSLYTLPGAQASFGHCCWISSALLQQSRAQKVMYRSIPSPDLRLDGVRHFLSQSSDTLY